jgi:hypothetical protein
MSLATIKVSMIMIKYLEIKLIISKHRLKRFKDIILNEFFPFLTFVHIK